MFSKFSLSIKTLLLTFSVVLTYAGDISEKYAIKPEQSNFLALIEYKDESGSTKYYNGVIVSLTWVLTVSNTLAQMPTGRPGNDSISVYAGLESFDKIGSADKKAISRILTDVMGKEDNNYFPNLVLLRLESALPSNLRPAAFNIGMIGDKSRGVGWAVNSNDESKILARPVSFRMKALTSKKCSDYSLVEFMEQMCSHPLDTAELSLLEGALLVDNSRYVTALKQVNTYFQTKNGMPISIFVRVSYYKEWIQFHVNNPTPEMKFLETSVDDDLAIEPWYNKTLPTDGALQLFSHRTSILYTLSAACVLFL